VIALQNYTTVQSHSTAECPEKPVEFWTSEKREVVEEFWLFSDDLIPKNYLKKETFI